MSVERDEQTRFHEHLPGLIPFFCAFCAFSRQRGFPHLSRQIAHVPSNRLRIVVFQAGLKAGLCPAPASSGPVCPESRYCSRIAWPLGRWRPPAVLAMGQNRQKTGKTGLLTPSTNSVRLEPEWVRAKSNSPSPAQRSVQAGAQEANSYHSMAFGANHPIQLAEFTAKDVPVEEEQSVKGLVLGGSRHMLAHRQIREEAAHLLGSKARCRPAADEALKPGNPEAVGLQGSGRVVAQEDRRLELAVFLLPGSAASCPRWCGRLCAKQGGIG